jgi:hypothetical protein
MAPAQKSARAVANAQKEALYQNEIQPIRKGSLYVEPSYVFCPSRE